MITSFDDIFSITLGSEGNYSNNSKDPGGETMYGITIEVARKNGYTGSMKRLSLSIAKSIAKAEYWNVLNCHQMPPLIAFHIFDTAYHGGHPANWAQEILGQKVDGIVGAATIAAIRQVNPHFFIRKFNAKRLTYLTSLKIWPSFGRGWVRRIANNLEID